MATLKIEYDMNLPFLFRVAPFGMLTRAATCSIGSSKTCFPGRKWLLTDRGDPPSDPAAHQGLSTYPRQCGKMICHPHAPASVPHVHRSDGRRPSLRLPKGIIEQIHLTGTTCKQDFSRRTSMSKNICCVSHFQHAFPKTSLCHAFLCPF